MNANGRTPRVIAQNAADTCTICKYTVGLRADRNKSVGNACSPNFHIIHPERFTSGRRRIGI